MGGARWAGRTPSRRPSSSRRNRGSSVSEESSHGRVAHDRSGERLLLESLEINQNQVTALQFVKMMHPMSDIAVHPFDGMALYQQPRPRLVFKMPKVVPDQKAKFENDELFRRLSRECEVRYTGFRDRPLEERQRRFQDGCREGHTEIAFAAMGTNLQLTFGPAAGNYDSEPSQCDFEKERGKVHLRSHLIMNGVCVTWRGWFDLQRLDGVGCLEFDEESAAREDDVLREQLDCYNNRLRLFDEKQRAYRSGTVQPPHLNHHHHHHHLHHGHHVTGTAPGGGEPHNEMEVGLRAY